jgi:hypothetical protein
MKTLQRFVSDENRWRAVFGHQQIDIETAVGRQEVAAMLDSRLSPENLSCDGELSRSEITRRCRYYTAAAQQLKQLDPSVQMWEYQ